MKHNFGVIEKFEEDKWYSDYEPKKYNCISVSDDLIEGIVKEHLEELGKLKTYFQMKKHPGLGLDYCGITIIPPRSFKSSELENLINKINIAIRDNKHLIHYGI